MGRWKPEIAIEGRPVDFIAGFDRRDTDVPLLD
jgi:hypothetical protein